MPSSQVSHRSPVTRGRQLHCPLRASQTACKEPSAEQWQAGGGGGVGTRWNAGTHTPARPAPRGDTHGHRQGSRGNRGCTPGRWCRRSQGGSDMSRPHHRAGLGPRGGCSCRLQGTQGQAPGSAVAHLPFPLGPGPLLTAAVRVAMVAWTTAVTVGTIKLGPAGAAASPVAACGQGPCRAAAAHCGVEAHRGAERGGRGPSPCPPCPLGMPRSHWQRGKWK